MKNISSRYSLANISSTNYGNLNISGSTNYPIATLTSAGTYSQGYIFVPYIMSQTSTDIVDRDFEIRFRRQERIKKLEKIYEQMEQYIRK